jgi:spermidine synthase
MLAGFDPDFDDCRWTDGWTRLPIIQAVPGVYPSFTIKRWEITEAEVFGQPIRLSAPLEVRGLVMADGRLWMSDVPQERIMMFNNAQATHGRVLVGGLGLGLYPQYALPNCSSMLIVEQNADVLAVFGPLVQVAADSCGVPLTLRQGDIADILEAAPDQRYDTIFLDTWDTLDAANLPVVNRLRDLALHHLAPGGRVLLWGYRWMLRLLEEACRRVLSVEPAGRHDWLAVMTRKRPDVWRLLIPVVEHFAGQEITDWETTLAWCRQHGTQVVPE